MKSTVLLVNISVAVIVSICEARAAVPVNFGWGTDRVSGGAGYALYSDPAFSERLVGLGIGGSFSANDYVQLIVDLGGDGFAPPDFTRPDFVASSDKLLAEAFVGLEQNHPVLNPSEHTGQFWAGGMTQYGAQYSSDAPWMGKPIMIRFWDTPRDQILALHNDPDKEPFWGEYSGGMTLPASSTDWAFMEAAGANLYTNQREAPPALVLSVSATSFVFSAIEGGANPASQTLQIWNSGQGSLDWVVTEDIDWLSVSPDRGSSSGEKDAVTVSIDVSSLSSGDYSGNMTVSASGAEGSPKTVAIALEITAPGESELSVEPATLSFWAVEGRGNPLSQTLQVWNVGGGSLNWSLEENIPWLNASPMTGSSTGERDEVQVSVDITSLPAGTYNGEIIVSAPQAIGSPTSVEATLHVFLGGQLVYFGWGTDNTVGSDGYALYSDSALSHRLVGLGIGGSFDLNDYVQLIADLDADGFADPDFTRPDLVDPSDKLLAEAFIGVGQNSPATNPGEHTGQVWAGGMTQYGAQYNSDDPWVGKPIMVRFWDMPKGQIRAAYQDPTSEPHWGQYGGGMLLPATTADWSFTDAAGSDLYTDQSPPTLPPPGELVYFGWGTDKVVGREGYALYSDAALTQRLDGLGIGGSFGTNDYVQLIVDLDGDGFARPDFARPDFVDPSDKLLAEAFIGLGQNSPAMNPNEHTGQFWAGGMTQYGAQYNSNDLWVGKPVMVRFWNTPKDDILTLYQGPDPGLLWGEYSGGMTLPATSTDWSFTDSAQSDLYTSMGINQAPVLSAIGDRQVDENQLLTFIVTATDPDGTTPTLTASNLPQGATFVDNGDGTATFTWTPTYDQAGSYPGVHFEGSDGVFTDSEDIIIVVHNVNRPPVLSPIGNKQVDENVSLNFTVAASDPDGATPTLSATNLPNGAEFTDNSDGTGTFTWTPVGAQVGAHPDVHFEASDGQLVDSENITIEVRSGGNHAPVLAPITNKIIYENNLLEFMVSATDPDGTIPALTASNLPDGASFVDNGNGTGTFTWTPTYQQSGNYHNIVFEASDGELTHTRTIYITVVNVNVPPVLSSIGNKEVIQGQSLSFTVSATDPDGTTPTLSASNLPQGATFTDNQDGTGTFTWAPGSDQVGSYPGVHFEAGDGELAASEDIVVTVVSSHPAVILEVTITAQGKLRLRWGAFGTGLYRVQRCHDLLGGTWQDIPGISWPIPDTVWEGDMEAMPCCFYRVIAQ